MKKIFLLVLILTNIPEANSSYERVSGTSQANYVYFKAVKLCGLPNKEDKVNGSFFRDCKNLSTENIEVVNRLMNDMSYYKIEGSYFQTYSDRYGITGFSYAKFENGERKVLFESEKLTEIIKFCKANRKLGFCNSKIFKKLLSQHPFKKKGDPSR